MMQFIDRVEERRRLQAFFAGDEGGLVCLYGRRRIGKRRLLAENPQRGELGMPWVLGAGE